MRRRPNSCRRLRAALAARLTEQKDLYRSVVQPQGGSFFAQSGLLFLPADKLEQQMKMLTQAQRLIGTMAADPSLRGVIRALQFALLGVQSDKLTLDDMKWPLTRAADTLELVNAGKPASFSWQVLVQGHEAQASDLVPIFANHGGSRLLGAAAWAAGQRRRSAKPQPISIWRRSIRPPSA